MKDTKGKILETARALYHEEGVRGVTMRRIARRTGITATAIYHHYPNKEALVDTLHQEALNTFKLYLHDALAGEDALDRIKRCLDAYLRFAIEQERFYETLFLVGEGPHISQYPHDFRAMRSSTFRFLVDRVTECIQAGAFKQDDPIEVALSIIAHAHGLVLLYRTGRFGHKTEVFKPFFHASFNRFLAGLVNLQLQEHG